mmetsp:Transcript_25331/g.76057  ORF Transcript_25331/g.76057 Transcript_25331/m.76057 type:complete len:153 (+) Transcript_25331:295-753(+)
MTYASIPPTADESRTRAAPQWRAKLGAAVLFALAVGAVVGAAVSSKVPATSDTGSSDTQLDAWADYYAKFRPTPNPAWNGETYRPTSRPTPQPTYRPTRHNSGNLREGCYCDWDEDCAGSLICSSGSISGYHTRVCNKGWSHGTSNIPLRHC